MTFEEKQEKIEQYYLPFLKARYDNELFKEKAEAFYSADRLSRKKCIAIAEEAIIAVDVLEEALKSSSEFR